MSATKESELITAVMLYAARCAVEGDHNALHAMNFGPREVDALTDVALGDIQRMDVDTAESVKPTRVKLQFANPYAYRGAQLLASYDGFARRLLSAQYVGLLTRSDAEQRLHHAAKPIRRAFASALGYRFLAITRSDVDQQTAKAE